MLRDILYRLFGITFDLNIYTKRNTKKSATSYIFVHGLGDTGAMWDDLITQLPDATNYLVVDLLGFGKSVRPRWTTYSVATQSSSLAKTCRKAHFQGPYTIIGHSLGSLVAVEFALRFPSQVNRLILCAPPIYQGIRPESNDRSPTRQEVVLRSLYEQVLKRPKDIVRAWSLAKKLGLLKESAHLDASTLRAFTSSLRVSILNQNTKIDILKVKKPITIIRGMFDPLVVGVNLEHAAAQKSSINVVTIPAGHILNKRYEKEILRVLTATKPTKHTKHGALP